MANIKVDKQIYEVAVEGMERAKAQMQDLVNTFSRSMSGMEKGGVAGTAGLLHALPELKQKASDVSNTLQTVSDVTKKVGNEAKNTAKNTREFNAAMQHGKGLFSQWIERGMLMSIGWQAINNAMLFGFKTVKDYFMANAELEVSMKSLEFVARRTGRSFADVTQLINNNLDGMTDRATVTTAVMKMMGTSLSTEQLDSWIKSVKAGSAAMGADFNEQIIIQAKGFKQLTANILDNIGVTIYLDQVKERASKTYGISVAMLSEEQIHQQLLVEQLKQTEKYMGLWEERMETTQGALSRLGTSWKILMQTIGDKETIKGVADSLAGIIETRTIEQQWKEKIGKLGKEMPMMEVDVVREAGKQIGESFGTGFYGTAVAAFAATMYGLNELMFTPIEGKNINLIPNIQEMKWDLEDLNDIEADRIKTMEENKELVLKQTKEYEQYNKELEQAKQLTEDNRLLLDLLNTTYEENEVLLRELQTGYSGLNDGVLVMVSDSLPKWRDELEKVNDALSTQKDDLRDTESLIHDLESELAKKLKVFDPTEIKTTEQLLADVRKELQGIDKDQEAIEKKMWKRIEPKLRKEYKKESIELQNEENQKLKIEEETRKKLINEIQNMQSELIIQKKLKDEILLRTIDIEGATYGLAEAEEYVSGKIDTIKDKMDIIRNTNFFTKEQIDEETKKLQPLGAVLDILQEKVNLFLAGTGSIADVGEAISDVANIVSPTPSRGGGGVSRVEYPEVTIGPIIPSAPSDLATGFSPAPTLGYLPEYNQNPYANFETGTKFVPKTGLYQLHIGETVNNRNQSNQNTKGTTMSFGAGSIVIQGTNKSAEQMFDELERVATRRISRGVKT